MLLIVTTIINTCNEVFNSQLYCEQNRLPLFCLQINTIFFPFSPDAKKRGTFSIRNSFLFPAWPRLRLRCNVMVSFPRRDDSSPSFRTRERRRTTQGEKFRGLLSPLMTHFVQPGKHVRLLPGANSIYSRNEYCRK